MKKMFWIIMFCCVLLVSCRDSGVTNNTDSTSTFSQTQSYNTTQSHAQITQTQTISTTQETKPETTPETTPKTKPLTTPEEIKEESGRDMYSSYAFLSSFNPSTGIAKFDYINVVENEEEGYEYINNSIKLREVNIRKLDIDVYIDGDVNYWISGKPTLSEYRSNFYGFRQLYLLDQEKNPERGLLFNCLYYISVSKNGTPSWIKIIWIRK